MRTNQAVLSFPETVVSSPAGQGREHKPTKLKSLGLYHNFSTFESCLKIFRSSRCGSVVKNPTRVHDDVGLTPALAWWVKDLVLL